MFGKLKEKVSSAVSTASETTLNVKADGFEKAKNYLSSHRDQIKDKVSGNEAVAKVLADKAVAMVSIALIASFLYALLPAPIQWVVSEESFEEFVEENVDFLIEILA